MDTARLTAFPVFAELPSDELRELAAVMTEVEVESGASVVGHGDEGYAMYVIEQGEAEVLVDGDEEAHVLGPGDMFGEIAFSCPGAGPPPSRRARRCGFCGCSPRTSGGFALACLSSNRRCAGSAASA